MDFMNGNTLGSNGTELIRVRQAGYMNNDVLIGGIIIGSYESEESALEVKRVLDNAFQSAYLSDIQYIK